MRRRAPSLIALAGVVALILAAAPAVALSPFGSTVEVVESSCRFEDSTGDAVMGSDGILRGFVDFAGGNCPGSAAIRYYEKDGGDVTVETSPYRGDVLSVTSDATGVYLLYQARNGSLYLTKRTSGGVFTAGRRLSSVKEDGPVEGDVIANGGTWWAVWTEPVPGGRQAATSLNQAKTMGTDIPFQRLTTASVGLELTPSLALRPGNRAALAWSRTPSVNTDWIALWVGAADSNGKWRSRQFELAPVAGGGVHILPSVFVTGPTTYIAWQHDATIMVADNRGGSFKAKSFLTPGVLPTVSASGGKVFVGWTSIRSPERAFITQRVGSTWSGNYVSPATSHHQSMAGTFSFSGDATALMLSPSRLYARSQGS
jgi:hypothetical protein